MRRLKFNKQTKSLDRRLFLITILLIGIGIVAVADASAPTAIRVFEDKYYFVKQQLVWVMAGVFLMGLFSQIDYRFWEKISVPLFAINLFLLIAVLIPGIGVSVSGARRWIVVGSLSMQPTELLKLTLVVYLAKVASKNKKPLSFLVPLGIALFLIMLEPDLGTAVVVSMIGVTQFFLSGVNLAYIVGSGIFGVLSALLLILTSSYRKERLLTFLEQTRDPLGEGYHIRQVLFALGSGGLFGVGLGQSRQKYLFLPEAATDSIFAIIAEEVGFVGATILILIIFSFLYRGLQIAKNGPDKFAKVLAGGIVVWIGGQSFVNMAAMVAIVPLTGIPLPFVSYGGSSIVTVLIATGILLNISKNASKSKK